MTLGEIVPRRLRRGYDELPFVSLQKQMNKFLDDILGGELQALRAWPTDRSTFAPKINVKEDSKQLVVSCELPGLEEKDFEISLNQDALLIKGEKKFEQEKTEGAQIYYESSYGSFERSVPLSFEVDEDKVEAVFKNGVLTLTLPKSMEAQKQTRKISVKRG